MPAAHDAASNSGGRRPKASNGGNRGKGYEGRAAGSMGICLWRVNLRSEFHRRPASGATATLTFRHECCEGGKSTFLISCNFKQLRVAKKSAHFNFCVRRLIPIFEAHGKDDAEQSHAAPSREADAVFDAPPPQCVTTMKSVFFPVSWLIP